MPPTDPTICPTCGRRCTPVYAAASTDAAPLLLAYTVVQAAERLGITPQALHRGHLAPWRGGWRLTGRAMRKEAA